VLREVKVLWGLEPFAGRDPPSLRYGEAG
jgi:hypothetical protein